MLEALELLAEAREVLDQYRFSSDDEEEYNNNDVIDIIAKIDAFIMKELE